LNTVYRVHAIERMFEREISKSDVESIIKSGEIIKTYPNDKPYSSNLILGYIDDRAIHVVYAIDENATIIIITVYEPTLDVWQEGFKERRRI